MNKDINLLESYNLKNKNRNVDVKSLELHENDILEEEEVELK